MEKESVKKFDLEAAFKALDEIDVPETKGIKANRVDLKERFSHKPATETLVEDYYDISSTDELEAAHDEREAEINKAKLARIEKIVDLDAESPEDLLPSYVGKVIMQCPQCMTLFYKNPEDIEHDEENPDVVNINEVCQHCGNTSGYTLIGKVDSVSEEEADQYTEEPAGEESELDLDFEAPTEEVDAEGTGEGAEEMSGSDLDLDELDLDLEETPEDETVEEEEKEEKEKKEESLNLSKEAESEHETEHKSENLTLNEEGNAAWQALSTEPRGNYKKVKDDPKWLASPKYIIYGVDANGKVITEKTITNESGKASEVKAIRDEILNSDEKITDVFVSRFYTHEDSGETLEVELDSYTISKNVDESLNNSEALKDAEEGSELKTENESENLTLNEDLTKISLEEYFKQPAIKRALQNYIDAPKDENGHIIRKGEEEIVVVRHDGKEDKYLFDSKEDAGNFFHALSAVQGQKIDDVLTESLNEKFYACAEIDGEERKFPFDTKEEAHNYLDYIKGGHEFSGKNIGSLWTESFSGEKLTEEIDKDLETKLKAHNDYIAYLQQMIKQEEEALKKADNEEIKAAIQRRLDAFSADLEAALPDAVKEEAPVEEIAEEPVIEEEPKDETVEEETPVEEALTEETEECKVVLSDNPDKEVFAGTKEECEQIIEQNKETNTAKEHGLEIAEPAVDESLNASEAQKEAAENSELATENHSENLTLNESDDETATDEEDIESPAEEAEEIAEEKLEASEREEVLDVLEDKLDIKADEAGETLVVSEKGQAENPDAPKVEVEISEEEKEILEPELQEVSLENEAEEAEKEETEEAESEEIEESATVEEAKATEAIEEDIGGALTDLFDSPEFKKPITDAEVERYLNDPKLESIEEFQEESFNKHVTEFLHEVYSNVDSFNTTSCDIKEGKLIVEGCIKFNSGKEKLTVFEFLPNFGEGSLFLEGLNKDFSDTPAFKANCTVINNSIIVEDLAYKFKINETLVEGLK